MWENFAVTMILALVTEPILSRVQKRWRRMRIVRTVAALERGDTARIRCAARFRNSGGGRHRARLTVKAEGVFPSTADGTVTELRLGAPSPTVEAEVVAERSMLVYDVAGRRLEILLPAEEDRLFTAVLARALGRSDENATTSATPSTSPSDRSSPHHDG
ncbi:hypothetical protein [Streptomyces sp. NPDC058751]|uniref:hypothetical protein n=1 Tax=Streptomyces sp. NPDC058751 TaxID=3346623 RepID=UPI003693DE9E